MTKEQAERKAAKRTAAGVPTFVHANASRRGGFQTLGVATARRSNATYRRTEKGVLTARRNNAHQVERGNNAAWMTKYRERQRYELASVLVEPQLRHAVSGATVVAVLGDQQIPFEDPAAMDAALEVVAAVKADTVILNGDVVDCYAESVFLKDWKLAALATKESHVRARRYMECLEHIPQKIWLGGNHEERWKKEIWREVAKGDKAGAIASNLVAAMNAKGQEIDLGDPVGSFERIYSMGEHGFKYYPYHHRLYLAEGNLVITHGEYVRKDAGAAARATYEWLGKSVIVGHTHRMGSYYRKTDEKEHGGWEGGCLCQLEPEYCTTPNWQQGLTLVRIDGPEFHVIPVPIIRRRGKPVAVYQGE